MPRPSIKIELFRKVLDDYLETSSEEFLKDIPIEKNKELDEEKKKCLKNGFVNGFLRGVKIVLDSIPGYIGVMEEMEKELKTKMIENGPIL